MKRISSLTAGGLLTALIAAPVGAQVVQFAVPDQGLPYSEAGFNFNATGGGSAFSDWGVDSGDLLVAVSDGGAQIVMTVSGGGTFDLFSLDYAFGGDPNVGFDEWEITSDLGGSIVLDGLSSTGSVSPNWLGVTEVRFEVFEPGAVGPNFLRIDNINVPEPGSLMLLAVGAAGIVTSRRRDRAEGASASSPSRYQWR